jgi:hypothetical protein
LKREGDSFFLLPRIDPGRADDAAASGMRAHARATVARGALFCCYEECTMNVTSWSRLLRPKSKAPQRRCDPEAAEKNRRFREQCVQMKQELAGCRATLVNLKTKCAQNPDQVLAECRSIKQVFARCRQILLAMQGDLTAKGEGDADIPEVP